MNHMSNTAPKQETTPTALPPETALLEMISGMWVSQIVYVAARLGLADLVAEGPKTADELATATKTDARALYRLLRALASKGVFVEQDGRFAQNELSALLTSSLTSSRAMALHCGEPASWRAWGNLLHSIETGETAFVDAHGSEIFPYYAAHPESCEVFDDAMTNFSEGASKAVVAAYDFTPYATIVDVGGGHGRLLAGILDAAPDARGVLFDQPATVAGAGASFDRFGVRNRVTVEGGNFFEAVPEGGDAYVLKHILHDWEDERALEILGAIHRASQPGAKLLVVDTVVPGPGEPSFAPLMDVHMMVMTGGCERTEAEWRDLFDRAGFTLDRIVPTEAIVSVVEATRRA